MSKYVKQLIANDLRQRLSGVNDLLLVNVIGLDAIRADTLRRELRKKDIHLLVVKSSLARRATEGTALATAFEGAEGALALAWGAGDIVSLAKEVTRLAADKKFERFSAKGGVMDGARLSPEEVAAVSKWPTREEQLSLLVGQILSPGGKLSSQLVGVGAALASQIKQKGEEEEAESAAEPAAAG